MGRIAKVAGALVAALALVAVMATSVFAADPFASAITSATSTTVSDYTGVVGDVIPVLLGIAVLTMLARRALRFFR